MTEQKKSDKWVKWAGRAYCVAVVFYAIAFGGYLVAAHNYLRCH